MTRYTTRHVAELMGLTSDQVRHYIRRGLITPGRGAAGEYRFGFQDLVLLRTAKGLRDARVSPRRAFAALVRLRQMLGEARSLTSLRIVAVGGTVMVRETDGLWSPESGQGQLDFSVETLAGEVAALRIREVTGTDVGDAGAADLGSDDWYNLGVDLEELDPERAQAAYEVAVELDADNVDAHVNLGRLLQCLGRLDEARAHYQRALDRQPDHQVALYNLGTVFDEHDELEAAVECYSRADGVADAHYNLCRIFELRGDRLAALRHLRRYQQLTGRDR